MPLEKVIKIKIRNLFLFLIFIILNQTHLFALEKKKLASIDDAMIVKPAKPKNPEQASNKSSTVKATSTKSKTNGDKKPKSFAEAFKAAKGQKTFTFKGKSYARVTKDEMEKAGFKSLRAYLNAQKTTRVAKK